MISRFERGGGQHTEWRNGRPGSGASSLRRRRRHCRRGYLRCRRRGGRSCRSRERRRGRRSGGRRGCGRRIGGGGGGGGSCNDPWRREEVEEEWSGDAARKAEGIRDSDVEEEEAAGARYSGSASGGWPCCWSLWEGRVLNLFRSQIPLCRCNNKNFLTCNTFSFS